jgi:hypothetical protein
MPIYLVGRSFDSIITFITFWRTCQVRRPGRACLFLLYAPWVIRRQTKTFTHASRREVRRGGSGAYSNSNTTVPILFHHIWSYCILAWRRSLFLAFLAGLLLFFCCGLILARLRLIWVCEQSFPRMCLCLSACKRTG